MIRLNAQLDSNLAKFAGNQMPFAASLALNRTAVGARDLVRGNLPRRFTLRNGWTQGGVQARTSTKTNLVARVLAPDYMAIQETGGERRPTKSKMLAAPGKALQGPTVIPKTKRPRALLKGKAFIIGMPDGDAGVFERHGKKRGQIKLLYWLTGEQGYEERFEFQSDVQDYVQGKFSVHFAAALADAMK